MKEINCANALSKFDSDDEEDIRQQPKQKLIIAI